jgi:hypothetical protein
MNLSTFVTVCKHRAPAATWGPGFDILALGPVEKMIVTKMNPSRTDCDELASVLKKL